MKRILALVCVMLLLLPLIVSCAQETPSQSGTGSNTGKIIYPSNPPVSNCPPSIIDRLPMGEALEALGFAGSQVNLLSWEGEEATTFPTSDSPTDPLQSKLYWHWLGIQERFDITIQASYVSSDNNAKEEFLTTARAEGATYDLIQTQSLFPMALAMEGRLCNLRNLGYPDLQMPWWPSSEYEWSEAGALYFAMSNSSARGIANMSVIFANEEMITDMGGASPVQSVLRGVWTVEEMTTVAKRFAGTAEAPSEASRMYGLVIDDPSRLDAFYYAVNLHSVQKNADGYNTLAYDEESELAAISDAVAAFEEVMTGSQTVIHSGEDYTELNESRAALFAGYMEYIQKISSVEDYVVIPLPMLDEAQYDTVGYRTPLRTLHDVWCMPTTTSNKVLSGMVLEGNASSEYRIIGPFYFEQFLKDNYANGADGRKCFNILRDSIVYDFGQVAQHHGIGAEGYWRACFYDDGQLRYQNVFTERYQAVKDTEQDPNDALRNILQAFEQYQNQ